MMGAFCVLALGTTACADTRDLGRSPSTPAQIDAPASISQPTSAATSAPTAAAAQAPTPQKPAPTASASTSHDSATTWWRPASRPSWDYQLSVSADPATAVDILISDLEDTTAAQVAAIHARGGRAVCYVSAGSYEDWRADAADFPATVLGAALDGWPGERWLDIRQVKALRPILEHRVEACAAKGFDGIDFDNVDGYTHDTGFPLVDADQRSYNLMLADLAHSYGLAVGLKNNVDQIPGLVNAFDFAVNESCLEYAECSAYQPFLAAGKPVLHVEYDPAAGVCANPARAGLSSIIKNWDLDTWVQRC